MPPNEVTLPNGQVITIEHHDVESMTPKLLKEYADFIKRVRTEDEAREQPE